METIEFNDYYKDILFSIPLFRDLNTHIKKKLIQELDFNLLGCPVRCTNFSSLS